MTFPPLLLCAWSWSKAGGGRGGIGGPCRTTLLPPALSLCPGSRDFLDVAPFTCAALAHPRTQLCHCSAQSRCCCLMPHSPPLLFLLSPLCPPLQQVRLCFWRTQTVFLLWYVDFLLSHDFELKVVPRLAQRTGLNSVRSYLQEATSSNFLKVESGILLNS